MHRKKIEDHEYQNKVNMEVIRRHKNQRKSTEQVNYEEYKERKK